MNHNRGFTLIETLIAAAILVCGLAAVAAVFSYAVQANMHNRRLIAATALLYDKMEEFRSVAPTDPLWEQTSGSDEAGSDRAYTRVWHVSGKVPRSVTVIVYGPISPITHHRAELIRGTTLAAPVF
jgi:prepilin-type N-terminal cleavage/methylation domain-containing protein